LSLAASDTRGVSPENTPAERPAALAENDLITVRRETRRADERCDDM
jgi:hypothetical protein